MSEETLELVYKDEYIVAINKPSGLLVHKSPIDKHEIRFAMKILRDQLNQWVYPVHRLDKPTSGLLLFALDKNVAAALGQQFETREVKKTYRALVRGFVKTEGLIDHPIRETAVFKHQKQKFDDKPPQNALTKYHPLMKYELPFSDGRFDTSRYTLLELFPETGRRHQLRKHLKHISHPIVGDAKYGKGQHNRLFQREFNCGRLLLAATHLELAHPVTGETLGLEAALEDVFARLLEDLAPYAVE